jgi:DNA-binding response OmpR family regulator
MVASYTAVRPKVVLLIAERSSVCEELMAALQEQGVATMTASNACDAAVALHVSQPAAILADWDQQGFDGWQILWRLRTHEHAVAQIPLMLMTDRPMTADLRRSVGFSGVRWIFQKPLSLNDVSRVVHDTVCAPAPAARRSEPFLPRPTAFAPMALRR